ncbi:energy transducer TonB [Geothrix limicola]|uniref:energy transducer TonB n=1 Tax=Geothrix limicola TaxID=2927978 RepID=UPI00255510F2|nr:hypothetical protein [Geothrix limicola]
MNSSPVQHQPALITWIGAKTLILVSLISLVDCAPLANKPLIEEPSKMTATVNRPSILSFTPIPDIRRKEGAPKITGYAVIKLIVDSDGNPIELKAISGNLELQPYAIEWIKKVKFNPAKVITSTHPEGIILGAHVHMKVIWGNESNNFEIL